MGFGGEDQYLEAGVGGEVQGFEGEVEVSDDGMVDAFGACLVGTDVVCALESAEEVAASLSYDA